MSKIIKWDALLIKKNIDPIPVISIKIDEKILSHARNNNNNILLKFNKTNSIYDNKEIFASIYTPPLSSDTISIILNSYWYGYPDNTGEYEIIGLPIDDNIKSENILENKVIKNIKQKKQISIKIIVILSGFGFLFLFLITLFLKNKISKYNK